MGHALRSFNSSSRPEIEIYAVETVSMTGTDLENKARSEDILSAAPQ